MQDNVQGRAYCKRLIERHPVGAYRIATIPTTSTDFQGHSSVALQLPVFFSDIFLNLTAVPILSVFPALIVHSELKSVHPGFPVAFIF